MLRVVLGLLKGGLVGAGIGFLAWKMGLSAGIPAYFAYGLVGALAGVVAGRPPWRQETLWTPLLKGMFGFGIGLLLFWGARKLLGGLQLPALRSIAGDHPLVDVPVLLGPVVGAIWGILVEIDDSGGAEDRAKARAGGGAGAPPPAVKK